MTIPPRPEFRELLYHKTPGTRNPYLGGWGQVFSSQKLFRKDIGSILDDRTLNHAYRVFGGKPKVILNAANDGISAETRNRLSGMTITAA